MSYQALQGETVSFQGHEAYTSHAYLARPLTTRRIPGVVVIHHMPGWDEWTTDVVRRFAHHGYAAMAPNLFVRFGPGDPDDVTARARPAGGAYDAEVMGDVAGCMAYLRSMPNANGKIGVIGFCSGGRHTYLAACTLPGVDAAVDCWGGRVIVDDPKDFSPQRAVAPIQYTTRLACPLLGIFGNDDRNPNADQVNRTELELKRLGKNYEFHRYDGAGHSFFDYGRTSFRPEQAADAWEKVFAFFNKHLAAAEPPAAI